ncbi:hypothetical protein PISMIDRAFT_22792 [Pisolithus microcarpus 441]|uniref:Uncharacterized protein n=1 Tax=Pisolithus microcarpus 441 TaxID=765257 RepID=A0A0D0A0T8_9AGAM|nr:hypothetical protein PISMIDRAFT_22792 [Pisolithus microcarpus 441]
MALIAMTATPITSKAQDPYIMGQWMGVLNFVDHKESLKLNKEINWAKLARLKGKYNQNTLDMESPAIIWDWMIKISINFAGNKLFGMLPYQEHTLKLQRENPITNVDMKPLPSSLPGHMVTIWVFYATPDAQSKEQWSLEELESLKKWQSAEKAIKLDTLAQVVHHYLEKNGHAPLAMHLK